MYVEEKKGNVIVYDIEDFDLEQTIECGQCFHYACFNKNHYGISAMGRFIEVSQEGGNITFHNIGLDEYDGVWKKYFDIERDYGKIKSLLLEKDTKLKEAIDSMWGIRILNQDFFETLISFIISQNNHIPRIKGLVSVISEKYGHYLCERNGVHFYSFPTQNELRKADEQTLRDLKTGFRAAYIVDACKAMEDGRLDEKELVGMDYETAKKTLMSVKGIGEKVADCVLLFGLGVRSAFPVDVWIKRIMEELYFEGDTPKPVINQRAEELFGEYGGYAQQYLFYYGKKMKIGTKKEK